MEGPGLPVEDIEAALNQILTSETFAAVSRLSKFLNYVVQTTIAGRQDQIKETVIAIDVYGRDADFDPRTNPLVRVDASRLRRRMKEYYAEEGAKDDFRIELPKGTYVPRFVRIDPPMGVSKRPVPLAVPVQGASNLPSIGIVEFSSLTNEHSYIGSGLTEEIKHDLQRFADVKVIAPRGVPEEEALNLIKSVDAQYLLAGSVQIAGDQMRVIAELQNFATSELLWSERWDRTLNATSLFELQDEIAERVVGNVASPFGVINRDRLKHVSVRNRQDVDTYEWVVTYYEYQRYETREVNSTLREVFYRFVKDDPNYPQAWAILSHLEVDKWRSDFEPNLAASTSLNRAEEYATKAISLERSNTLALYNLANVFAHRKEYEWIVQCSNQVLTVNPCDARAIGWISMWYAMFEKWDIAMEYASRARQLNPLDGSTADIAELLHALHSEDYNRAWKLIESYKDLQVIWAQVLVMICAYKVKKFDLAISVLNKLRGSDPGLDLKKEFGKYPYSDSRISWFVEVADQIDRHQTSKQP